MFPLAGKDFPTTSDELAAAIQDKLEEVFTLPKKGGVTGHTLFQRCLKTGEFESITRGYVDAEKVVGLAKNLAGPFVPGLGNERHQIGGTSSPVPPTQMADRTDEPSGESGQPPGSPLSFWTPKRVGR